MLRDCFDNSVAASCSATLQTDLLDRHACATSEDLAAAVFAFIEVSTTPAAGTPPSATSAAPTTRLRPRLDDPTRPQHDRVHHTRTVRADGALHNDLDHTRHISERPRTAYNGIERLGHGRQVDPTNGRDLPRRRREAVLSTPRLLPIRCPPGGAHRAVPAGLGTAANRVDRDRCAIGLTC